MYAQNGESMNAIRQYLLSITAAALLFSFASELLSNGKWKKISGFLGSMILVLTIISPVVSLDTDEVARSISKLWLETQAAQSGIEINSRELQSTLIKENMQTYIQERAMMLGVQLEADVRMKDNGQFPVPDRVVLHGLISVEQMEMLSRLISQDLGIPVDMQEWIVD